MDAYLSQEVPSESDLVISVAELAAVEAGTEVCLTREGRPVARLVPIDPDQWWFWTPQWQAMEREVDEDTTEGTLYMSGEEFIAALETDIARSYSADLEPGDPRSELDPRGTVEVCHTHW